MNCIILSTNIRNVENWLPLFRLLLDEGHLISVCWLPWLGDPTNDRISSIPLLARYLRPITDLDKRGIGVDDLNFILSETVTLDVDIVFLCDMQSYPSNEVHRLLKKRKRSPIVIGLQHGLFQSWWSYNEQFGADHLLCFGDAHIRELDFALRPRAHAVGLPKLDNLVNIPTSDEGFILYLAQRLPNPTHVGPLLEDLVRKSGRKMVIHSHPQYPRLFGPRFSVASVVEVVSQSSDEYLKLVACASWVLTPHSTGGLEALLLGKPLVLIPNHGLTAWAGYPGVAFDLTADEVISALARVESCQSEVNLFLVDKLGGLRFDSARRARDVIWRLYEDHEIRRFTS